MKTILTVSRIGFALILIIGILSLNACSKKPNVGPSKGTLLLEKFTAWNETAVSFGNDPASLAVKPVNEHIAIVFKSDGTYVWGPNSGTWSLSNNDSTLLLTPSTGFAIDYTVSISEGLLTMLHPKGSYQYIDTALDTISPVYNYEMVSYTGVSK